MGFELVEKVMCIGGEGNPSLQFYKRGFNLGGTGETPSWQDIVLSGNGSLSLTEALANGLNYLKLFGGTEQTGTPTPDTPMDIVCNNGAVKVNKNLYSTEYHDKNLSLTDGVTITTNTGVNVSAMVDCRTIKSFKITTISPQGSFRIFKYGTDNTFINSNSTGNIGDIVTFEDNVGFFRIQYNYTSASVDTEDILIYNSAYSLNGIYTDGTVETVQVTGKNLIDLNAVTDGYYYDSSGTYTSSSTSRLTDYMPVEAGRSVAVYFKSLSAGTLNVRINIFNSNKIWQSQEVLQLAPNADGTKIITPTANGYIRVSANYAFPSYVDWDTAYVSEILGTATAENLFKLGNYQDIQNVTDGHITRNVGIKVLKGADDEFYVKNGNRYYYAPPNVLNEGNIRSTNLLCSHFLNSPTGVEGDCFKYSVQIYFYPNMTLCPDATAFKQWIVDQYNAGTPVIIVYPLAEPTTETVTAQSLTIRGGTNVVEITQASIDNLGLEVSYKATV